MMSRFFHIPAAFLLSALVSLSCGCASRPPEGRPVPRVTAWQADPQFSEGSEQSLLNWVRDETPVRAVMTPAERLPNGLAAGMMPLLVDWEGSRPDDADRGFYVVHNVHVAGNPALGQNLLATVEIPTHAIERVEYVMMRVAIRGPAKGAGHGQIRFVFKKDRRPRILGPQAEALMPEPFIDDLVMSWEAWRPPLETWTAMAGMDPEAFTLTGRLYSGAYRFLTDSLRGNFWECFPLQLPDVEGAADVLLHTCLMTGDSLTRRVIGDMIDLEQLAPHKLPSGDRWTRRDIRQAHEALDWDEMPEDPLTPMLSKADISYQTLQRSCITLALAQIDLAVQRIHDENGLGPRKRVEVAPERIPDWFDSMVQGDRTGMVTKAPALLIWFMNHQTVTPAKSYKLLEQADLLQQDRKGRTIRYLYDIRDMTPYGRLSDNNMQ